jgi:hypothetical protein
MWDDAECVDKGMPESSPVARTVTAQRSAILVEGGINVVNNDVNSLQVCQSAGICMVFEL